MCKEKNNKSLKLDENWELKEWLGFNYEDFVEEIQAVIDVDDFELLRAYNQFERDLGLLDSRQISELKEALKNGFRKGKTLLEIAEDIRKNTNLPDRKIMQNGKMVTQLDKNVRSIIIARTETTRAANGGSILQFMQNGITEYMWAATLDNRTSPICEELNGRIFGINSGMQPPAHVNCRSTLIPVVPGFDQFEYDI